MNVESARQQPPPTSPIVSHSPTARTTTDDMDTSTALNNNAQRTKSSSMRNLQKSSLLTTKLVNCHTPLRELKEVLALMQRGPDDNGSVALDQVFISATQIHHVVPLQALLQRHQSTRASQPNHTVTASEAPCRTLYMDKVVLELSSHFWSPLPSLSYSLQQQQHVASTNTTTHLHYLNFLASVLSECRIREIDFWVDDKLAFPTANEAPALTRAMFRLVSIPSLEVLGMFGKSFGRHNSAVMNGICQAISCKRNNLLTEILWAPSDEHNNPQSFPLLVQALRNYQWKGGSLTLSSSMSDDTWSALLKVLSCVHHLELHLTGLTSAGPPATFFKTTLQHNTSLQSLLLCGTAVLQCYESLPDDMNDILARNRILAGITGRLLIQQHNDNHNHDVNVTPGVLALILSHLAMSPKHLSSVFVLVRELYQPPDKTR